MGKTKNFTGPSAPKGGAGAQQRTAVNAMNFAMGKPQMRAAASEMNPAKTKGSVPKMAVNKGKKG